MFKQRRIKKACKKMSGNHRSEMSVEFNNLSSSMSNVNSTTCFSRKSKCTFSTISSVTSNKNCKSMIIKQPQIITKGLENAAVHFGNFYGLWDDVEKADCKNHLRGEMVVKKPQRLEFTRQMVHKLERAMDAEDYARQVSVLLRKTVEPPDFRLNQLLSKDSIPNASRSSSDYPLWYKEPKISSVFSNPIAQFKT
ncbi:uncharacterized protein LOC118647237 [Monomorium pharaonis]|uniref:uncharacterized protein LOC118647237 n=1 Tax=Monomorium pharaonis TaxID=307658 RepID=UPI001745D46E|nr:uncharacterized protein LOC118647237 [Monomorium pharaonis]